MQDKRLPPDSILVFYLQVKVYFFDYGNTESVDISELRPLPQEKVTQMTPPLALRCTLTPKQASFFRVDTHARLEELSTTNPVLRAVVLDNPGEISSCSVNSWKRRSDHKHGSS